MEHQYTNLVTILSVVVTLWFSMVVGYHRKDVKAPAMSGTPEFERASRVHLNTIEQMVLFLPSLWLALPVIGDLYTGALGGLWIVGRVLYAFGYWKDATKRSMGMNITALSGLSLLACALYGAVMAVL